MFRILSAGLIMIGLIVACDSVQAQFGRLGPGGFRPPLPPLPPIPAPMFAGPGHVPGYVRVPGVPPVVPAVVARQNYGYARNTAVVAVPLVVPVVPSTYSAARVAVVQPVPPTQYRAGSVGYATPSTTQPRPVPAPGAPQPNNSNSNGDLRPGMVLPDGAIVLSVGQPHTNAGSVASGPANGPTVASQPSFASPQSIPVQPGTVPTTAPQLGPTGSDASGTRSILEPAEELPVPQPSPATNSNSGARKF